MRKRLGREATRKQIRFQFEIVPEKSIAAKWCRNGYKGPHTFIRECESTGEDPREVMIAALRRHAGSVRNAGESLFLSFKTTNFILQILDLTHVPREIAEALATRYRLE